MSGDIIWIDGISYTAESISNITEESFEAVFFLNDKSDLIFILNSQKKIKISLGFRKDNEIKSVNGFFIINKYNDNKLNISAYYKRELTIAEIEMIRYYWHNLIDEACQ